VCLRYRSVLHFVQLGLDDGRGNSQDFKKIVKGGEVTIERRLEGPYGNDHGEKGAI
jgi:hypothetical protein